MSCLVFKRTIFPDLDLEVVGWRSTAHTLPGLQGRRPIQGGMSETSVFPGGKCFFVKHGMIRDLAYDIFCLHIDIKNGTVWLGKLVPNMPMVWPESNPRGSNFVLRHQGGPKDMNHIIKCSVFGIITLSPNFGAKHWSKMLWQSERCASPDLALIRPSFLRGPKPPLLLGHGIQQEWNLPNKSCKNVHGDSVSMYYCIGWYIP